MIVEFVSANPTGPLHVGHGRQAALGDAICNLSPPGLECPPRVHYNDAACRSTPWPPARRPVQRVQACDALWPEPAYNGDYIDDIARDFMPKKPSVR